MQQQQEGLWAHSRTIIIAVALAIVFRSLFYEPFHIPSGSMKSTLLVGDYLFVSKPSYGYSRYSFPLGLPLFKGRALALGQPQRGDIVVFRKPTDPSVDFIKRLIGLPGDTIQVKDSVLYLNGQAVPRKAIDPFVEYDAESRTQVSIPRYVETLPGGPSYTVLDQLSNGPVDNTDIYTVPPGHYFMMGDNRDNSTDSRYLQEVGFVPEENLVGKAVMVAFSFTDSFALRLERFFILL